MTTTATATGVAAPRQHARFLHLRRTARQFRRHKLAVAALTFLLLLALAAIFAGVVAPFDPFKQDYTAINEGPSGKHWFGTDALGRDILSRMLYGARVSLLSSVCAIGLTVVVAVPLAIWAGYVGGIVDNVLMRSTEALQCIPPLVLALALLGLLGPSLPNIVIALAIIFAPSFIRLIRGEVLAVREATYIEASKSIGSSWFFIVRRRVFHNIASPLIVQASVAMGFALLAEAGLSFIGMGVQLPNASWGNMLNEAYASIYVAPRQIYIPGGAIAITVLAFNLVGDGLRDALGVDSVDVKKQPL
jgi:peptide/nickel transport system permease protein